MPLRPSRTILLLGLAALVAGCGLPSSGSTLAGGPLPSGSWVARFVGVQGAGGSIRGDLRLTPSARPGEMRAEFDLQAIGPTSRHPWSVRSGRCGETNAVTVSTPAVQAIEGRADRTGYLRTSLPLRLEPGQDYHVLLAASASESETPVACGPLTFVP